MESHFGLTFFHDPEKDVNGLLKSRRAIMQRANTVGQFIKELDPNQQGIDFELRDNTKALNSKGIEPPKVSRDSFVSRIRRSIG